MNEKKQLIFTQEEQDWENYMEILKEERKQSKKKQIKKVILLNE